LSSSTRTSPSCPTGEGRPGSCPSWVSRLSGYVLHRTRTVVAFGLGPSPSAELALGAWAEAKAFLQAQVGRLPKALVHHDQGGPFLSHDWVGTLLKDGQRLSYSLMGAKGNPVVESFSPGSRGRGGTSFWRPKALWS
jgi:putative transposase